MEVSLLAKNIRLYRNNVKHCVCGVGQSRRGYNKHDHAPREEGIGAFREIYLFAVLSRVLYFIGGVDNVSISILTISKIDATAIMI